MTASPPVVVRRAEVGDAEALTDLHLDCWDDAYTGLVPQPVIDARRAQREQRIVMWADWMQRNSTLLAVDPALALAADTANAANAGGDTVPGGLVGFVTAGDKRDASYDGPELELMSLYCRARVWGTGVGHELLVRAIGDGPAHLWVLRANGRAVRFYEKHGFVLDGVEKACPEGVDARMVRT